MHGNKTQIYLFKDLLNSLKISLKPELFLLFIDDDVDDL